MASASERIIEADQPGQLVSETAPGGNITLAGPAGWRRLNLMPADPSRSRRSARRSRAPGDRSSPPRCRLECEQRSVPRAFRPAKGAPDTSKRRWSGATPPRPLRRKLTRREGQSENGFTASLAPDTVYQRRDRQPSPVGGEWRPALRRFRADSAVAVGSRTSARPPAAATRSRLYFVRRRRRLCRRGADVALRPHPFGMTGGEIPWVVPRTESMNPVQRNQILRTAGPRCR